MNLLLNQISTIGHVYILLTIYYTQELVRVSDSTSRTIIPSSMK